MPLSPLIPRQITIMTLNIHSLKALAVSVLLTATTFTASSQSLRLPADHNKQHKELIAHQRPLSSKLNAEQKRRLHDEVAAREADSDIFGQYWQSDRVNPYGNIAIPARKNIDVSEFVMPVKGRVTSPYGWRARFGRMHRGTDLSLNVGDTVRSAFSGKVRLTKYEGKGYGYYVVVRHDNGMETIYGHLSKFLVKPNQRVRAGQPIALGGNTGRSTGPHLHFETRYLGLAINPAAIVDFENMTTHKDVFAFDKSTYERSQHYGPRTATAKADTPKTSKHKSSKVSSSKKNSKKSKMTASSKSSKKSKSSKRRRR